MGRRQNIIHMITKELLNELFEYKEGCLFWKVKLNRNIVIGVRAGYVEKNTKRRRVRIFTKNYYEQRLIYIYHYGDIPENLFVDHIDCNVKNNDISNLRLVTHHQNQCNHRLSKSNKSGLKGVSWDRKGEKWMTSIKINRKSIYLGRYNTKEEAYEAYKEAALKYHGEYARF